MDRYWRNLDWILIVAVLALCGIGLCVIASATHADTLASGKPFYVQRQAMFMLVNVVLVVLSLRMDYRNLKNIYVELYGVMLVLLLGVLVAGTRMLGAQRWLVLGPIAFQPSEFCKAFMIVALAAFLSENVNHLMDFTDFWKPALVVGIPFVLVMRQPDLGTALVFAAIGGTMFFLCGFKLKWLGLGAVVGAISCPLLWKLLHEYQRSRIRVFLDPELDPYGSGYHVIQSKIAIGSGLLLGKGWMQGTQSQLRFLPENHTDFIFATAGEEFGFIGCAFILLLYLVVIWRGLHIALNAEDDFGTLLAVGITGMFMFHVLVNVGMTIGIMPVTGVPLPFLSYGVSSLTTNMLMAGLLLNIGSRRQKLQF